jgi:hypothetical protein
MGPKKCARSVSSIGRKYGKILDGPLPRAVLSRIAFEATISRRNGTRSGALRHQQLHGADK